MVAQFLSPVIVLFIMFSISEVVDHACMVDSNAYMQVIIIIIIIIIVVGQQKTKAAGCKSGMSQSREDSKLRMARRCATLLTRTPRDSIIFIRFHNYNLLHDFNHFIHTFSFTLHHFVGTRSPDLVRRQKCLFTW